MYVSSDLRRRVNQAAHALAQRFEAETRRRLLQDLELMSSLPEQRVYLDRAELAGANLPQSSAPARTEVAAC